MVKATAAASSEDEDGLLESAGGDEARDDGATAQGTSVCESIALVIRGNLGPGALAARSSGVSSGVAPRLNSFATHLDL